jgi:hypothetical protein
MLTDKLKEVKPNTTCRMVVKKLTTYKVPFEKSLKNVPVQPFRSRRGQSLYAHIMLLQKAVITDRPGDTKKIQIKFGQWNGR